MQDLISPSVFASYPSVRAGVSIRRGGISSDPLDMNMSYKVGDNPEHVRANRATFLEHLSSHESRTAFADQCHSSTMSVVSKPGLHHSCDALISRTPGIGLGISIADCVPVLLYDPISLSIAAIHAGWRGSLGRIVFKTCEMLKSMNGAHVDQVRAYIGPAAGVCCYEVGDDVFASFRDEIRRKGSGKGKLDLKLENKLQLQESGVRAEHIEVEARCTICHPELFHSYRRDGVRSGRMLAFIGL